MVQRCDWEHVVLETGVDEVIVVIDGQLIHRPPSKRLDSRPADRERIGFDAECGDASNVLLVEIVVVVSHVGSIVVELEVRDSMAQHVPNTRPTTLIFDGALDLPSGSGNAPPEILRERPGLILGLVWILLAGGKRRIVQRRRRNERARGDRRGRHRGRCGSLADRGDQKVPHILDIEHEWRRVGCWILNRASRAILQGDRRRDRLVEYLTSLEIRGRSRYGSSEEEQQSPGHGSKVTRIWVCSSRRKLVRRKQSWGTPTVGVIHFSPESPEPAFPSRQRRIRHNALRMAAR